MEVVKRGNSYSARPTKVKCESCKSTLKVNAGEWKKGTYGSEEIVTCVVCGEEIVRPGTEYTGDF